MKWNAPNVLTLLRIILIPVFVIFFFIDIPNWNIYAAIIFIVAAVTDWADGYLARKMNVVSNFGKLWDPVADKLLVLAALLTLLAWGKIGFVLVLIIMGRELIMSAVRAFAATKGVVIPADMAGKIKAVIQFIAIALLLLEDWPFAFLPFSLGQVLIWISAVLAIYSCIAYFVKNKQVFEDD